MQVLCVFGTRPETIKLAPVIRALRECPEVVIRVCVTGQHREMLDQALELFGIAPDWDLNLMKADQSLSGLLAGALEGIDGILVTGGPPDWVVVQGDTTTTMAGALAAFHRRVPVAHVEAGLRSGDLQHPFPEEANRKVVDLLCDLHFAPTDLAAQNLLAEGVPPQRVRVTGNTVIDALQWVASLPEPPDLAPHHSRPGERVLLVTVHRRESFGPPLERICRALRAVVDRHPDVRVLYPVHPNPHVQSAVRAALERHPRISLLPPLDYLRFVHLMRRAFLVLTDSGGIQEEAPALGKPVLVLREVTERPEAVHAGTALLVGTDPARIVAATARLLDDAAEYQRLARIVSPFGDGRAGQRIAAALLAHRRPGPLTFGPEHRAR